MKFLCKALTCCMMRAPYCHFRCLALHESTVVQRCALTALTKLSADKEMLNMLQSNVRGTDRIRSSERKDTRGHHLFAASVFRYKTKIAFSASNFVWPLCIAHSSFCCMIQKAQVECQSCKNILQLCCLPIMQQSEKHLMPFCLKGLTCISISTSYRHALYQR